MALGRAAGLLSCEGHHVHNSEDPTQKYACSREDGQQDGVRTSGRVHSVDDDTDDHSDTCCVEACSQNK